MPMVSKFEDLFQVFYGSFSSSPKHHFEFIKLSRTIEIERFKILQKFENNMDHHVSNLELGWERIQNFDC
jgi:hypothetical protein